MINNSKPYELIRLENTINKTWGEFRQALADGVFKCDDLNAAMECVFLKTYDDLFRQHSGIIYSTTCVKNIIVSKIGRGAILKDCETPNYNRFIPKKEYISADNRFSPSGVEWLYLAIGNTNDNILECAKKECRVTNGNRFGFCNFEFNSNYYDSKIVDLTIADQINYGEINKVLEKYMQKQINDAIRNYKKIGKVLINKDEDLMIEIIKKWSVYTYSKLLSEQILIPINNSDDKSIMYAPFHALANYYISLGYSGIIYRSTVFPMGKNIVLFNKEIAYPDGNIEINIID